MCQEDEIYIDTHVFFFSIDNLLVKRIKQTH